MRQSKSYRITAFGAPLELQTELLPEPGGTEVLVRVAACGVCHSDLHLWDGFLDLGGNRTVPMGNGERGLPLTPGHEIVGEVIAAGPDARGVAAGDRRVVYPWIGCAREDCTECARGDEHLCSKRALGIFAHGGFAEHVLVPHPRYLVAYDGLPAELAATAACSGLTAYAALTKVGRLPADAPLVIIGAGGVGMWAIRLARAVTGVAPVVADTDPDKRAAALANGATAAIDPAAADAVKTYQKTGGAAAAIDFVGAPASVRFGTGILRKGGRLIIVGLFGGSLQMPIPFFPLRELGIQGSYLGTLEQLRELVALAQRGLVGAIPVSARPLHDATQALTDLRNGAIVGRAVLTP
jgi:D-arabinose 1-dehydrogenase-like Zn-dependent alcohol dehydrogenase